MPIVRQPLIRWIVWLVITLAGLAFFTELGQLMAGKLIEEGMQYLELSIQAKPVAMTSVELGAQDWGLTMALATMGAIQ
ncbi:hypothetical protein ACQKPX_00030 [Photobacterium sp. DNB23_23_1]|uniref:Uncharacterized protein n=1 Tax=Photobacterium pectinilyticum TaxID=2906793 RepID=A0ABT1MYP7_9GAMM|nr:hypothetical protein [Photobacterium sp. ZSDE20]MCQ1057637.1 hypothetical protein [Photobacterium sp. ZSDE20]MDD1821958.1 hypothetical protein [Photobacterium sp. ZSDE20]